MAPPRNTEYTFSPFHYILQVLKLPYTFMSNDISVSEEDKLDIRRLAEGLSEDEVSLYVYGVPLGELSEETQRDFMQQFIRGRTNLKIHAINALKTQMHGRQGLQASLATLTRFAEAWPKVGNEESGGGNFNFRIVLKDDEE